jgi:hypothetical protein
MNEVRQLNTIRKMMSANQTSDILLVFRLNSGVKGNHRSKTVKIKGVNLAALDKPPGPHEHRPIGLPWQAANQSVQPVRLHL